MKLDQFTALLNKEADQRRAETRARVAALFDGLPPYKPFKWTGPTIQRAVRRRWVWRFRLYKEIGQKRGYPFLP